MHLQFDNVNSAFKNLVKGFCNKTIHTETKPSRNGNVWMIPTPVIITYNYPRERVLFNQARDCNPFFHVYEALWMLAGRNDVAPLDYYLGGKYSQYSDDGKTVNGAYGHRWRNASYKQLRLTGPGERLDWMEVDQLDILIEHLRGDPNSRRAVLQMWNVEDDLLKIETSRDVCCLSWDTKFRSPEGDTNIQELARRFQSRKNYRFPVYSVDTTTGDQRICWMTSAWKTGTRPTKLLKFDDGSSVRLTGDHTVFRKKKLFDGKRCVGVSIEECKVCDLSVGDRLLSELSKDSLCRISPEHRNKGKGYRQFKRNLFKNTGGSNMIKEHREYVSLFELLKKGHSIHHINGNKLDNRLVNLQQLDNSTHYSMDKFGEDNPHNKMSPEAKAARGRKHAASIKARWASMSPELKNALITRKKNRTPEQWLLVHEHKSSKSNHKIVAIEDGGTTAVFDFTVPGRHNAVLDNGIVVHNCNTNVYFSLRVTGATTGGFFEGGPKSGPTYSLDMTVINRSNDMIYGMLGANYVHFSFLQEYMANCIGVAVGTYNQFTNNLHAYEWNWRPEEWLSEYSGPGYMRYGDKEASFNTTVSSIPLVKYKETFDKEVKEFVEVNKDYKGITGDQSWKEPFLQNIAQPMCHAFHMHKQRDYPAAYNWVHLIGSPDWRWVASKWLEKREANWLKKSNKETCDE